MNATELMPTELVKIQSLDFQALNSLEPDRSHEEWLLQRKGRFTSSEIHRLMTCEKSPNKLPAGAITYVTEKVVESLTDGLPETFTSEAMQWGKDHEVEAIIQFMQKTKRMVKYVGDEQKFVKYGRHAGCTPDGLGTGFLAETKCPGSKNHFLYRQIKNAADLKEIEAKYYWQIQSALLFTRKKAAYFISFDPRFTKPKHRLHIAKIERNEADIDFIKLRLGLAIDLKLQMIDEANGKMPKRKRTSLELKKEQKTLQNSLL